MCFFVASGEPEATFGKKRGRKEDLQDERERLTASAAFHGFIIRDGYVEGLTEIRTVWEK